MAASPRPRDAHDRLVKRVFSRKAAFAVELRRVLPAELLIHLDLRTLARRSTEHTDERLRGRISDLCFTADLVDVERRRLVYFPLEHHSTFAGLLPLRAVTCATELWHEHLADRPKTKVFPLVVPIVFTQPLARHTPTRLSTILDVPPYVREVFPSPIEVRVYTDDFSGSVLDDPEADPATLALVELARAFLHAHGNPASLTKERLTQLAPLFEVLLGQREPLATDDVRALLTYVLRAFEEGSPVRALVRNAIRGRSREMFVSIADSLVEEGRKAGLSEGRKAGLSEGRKAGLSEGRKAGLSEGRKAGLARAVLRLLECRFSSVPERVRKRVSSSRDEHQLLRWLDRAVTASSAEDLLDGLDE
jgi:predicted transposase YdaD